MTLARAIAALLLLAPIWSAAAMEPLHVRDFGAVGDGRTDDGPAIRKTIQAAKASAKPTAIHFGKKTYRVAPRTDRWCAFAIEDARDIALRGNGATLLLHPDNRAFLIHRSERVQVRGFTIDYAPLPFTQGDVVRIDREAKEIVLRIHDGFPLPDGPVGRHGAFIEKDRHRYTHHWFYLGRVRCISKAERLYAVAGSEKAGHVARALQTEVGQRLVFPVLCRPNQGTRDPRSIRDERGVFLSNPAGLFQVRFSRDCALADIAIHASPSMSFRLTGTQDVVLRNISLTYKPDSGRLMVGASDGVHCKNNKTGPVIEDCLFEGLLDDSINLSTMSEDVLERLSDTEFRTGYSDVAWYDSSVAAGDTLLVYDPVKSVVLGEAVVRDVAFLRSHERRVTLGQAIPGIVDAKAVGRERATKFYIRKDSPAVVHNCVFRSQMKTAAVIRTPVLFENNTVEDTAYGVHASNSFKFGEGPVPYRQTYRGNRFRDCWISALQFHRMGQARPLPPGGGPLHVVGNDIVQGDGHGIGAHAFRDIVIRGNMITMRAGADPKLRAIHLSHCVDVTIADNTIEDPRAAIGGAVRIRAGPPDAVRLKGNTFRLAEGVGEVDTGQR